MVKPTGVLAGNGDADAVTLDGGRVCLTHLTTANFAGTAAGGEVLADYPGVLPAPAATPFQMDVHGTVNLAHMNLLTFTFAPALVLPAGASVVIIDNDSTDPVQGAFTTFPEGTQVIWGTRQFKITYHGGDGNDVALNLTGWGGQLPVGTAHVFYRRPPRSGARPRCCSRWTRSAWSAGSDSRGTASR